MTRPTFHRWLWLTVVAAIWLLLPPLPLRATWDKGFAFRQTSGYVTDGAGDTYVLATDTYSVTRNSVTFGWTVAPTDGRDRNNGIDVRMAGIVFGNANGTFRVDLPSTGSYLIRLAMGDAGANQQGMRITIKDNASTLVSLGPSTTSALEHFYDVSGVERSSAADWSANNVSTTQTFSTTTFILELGAATTNTCIAYLFLSQVSGGGATSHPCSSLRLLGVGCLASH